jgi:excisionase family DNA binding protein
MTINQLNGTDVHQEEGTNGVTKQVSLKKDPTVFTTGRAAKICRISQQTIIRCFDNGTLEGFHIPGSSHRRIPRAKLEKFMTDNGIPMDLLPPLNGESATNGDEEGADESTEAAAE